MRYLTKVGSFADDPSLPTPFPGVLDIVAPISWRQRPIFASKLLHVNRYSRSAEYVHVVEYSLPANRLPPGEFSFRHGGGERSAHGPVRRFRLLAPDDKCIRFRGASQHRPVTWAYYTFESGLRRRHSTEGENSYVTPVVGTSQWGPALAAADPNQAGGITIVAHLVVLINCEATFSTWRSQTSWRRPESGEF